MTGRDILIVEDENIVALDMRMRLESMGYRVVDVVDSGSMAVERAASLAPDLVLMDIKLKGDQDGIDAAGLLRERTEVPVIFVTAFTDERTLERAKRASPYGYIIKPFHERELRIAIELALYKHQYELSIRRARDAAEESNRIKGEFLANMSHELKTPLNSVIGFTELALSAAKETEQRDHLAMALSSAKSLLTLINSILDFARMEAGKLSAMAVPFSLDEVLGECTDVLAMSAFAKGLDVSLRRDPAIPDSIVGDSSLLKHILLNLLDNAVKFTDRGRVRLSATLHERPPYEGCGPTIAFEVADTGIGMPPDRIGQAFTRFTQLDPSKTRRAGGTGLGLAIVSKSVELMNGSLAVDSDEGKGTTVSLRLSFDLGSDDRPERNAADGWAGTRAALAGFDDEAYANAALVLERLGMTGERLSGIDEAAALDAELVIADERAIAGLNARSLSDFESRLIVGTRFGGGVRSRLEDEGNIAFTYLPLRAEGLRAALAALPPKRQPRSKKARKAAESSSAAIAEARQPATEASDASSASFLLRAADNLEAAAAGSFAAAEREAKDAQVELAASGDMAGSRIAFSALLHARKGDAAGLREAIARMRANASGIAASSGERGVP